MTTIGWPGLEWQMQGEVVEGSRGAPRLDQETRGPGAWQRLI